MKRSSTNAKEVRLMYVQFGWQVKRESLDFTLRRCVNPSMSKIKKSEEKGSHCLKPIDDLTCQTREVLRFIEEALEIHSCTQYLYYSGKFMHLRISNRSTLVDSVKCFHNAHFDSTSYWICSLLVNFH